MQTEIAIPKAYRELLATASRYKVFYGGRGAARSWSIARALLVRALRRRSRILCTRELQTSIADSVHRLLDDQIRLLDLGQYFAVGRQMINCLNGSAFIFEGLKNNVNKIKSLEGVDLCWVEEAEKISQNSWETLIPTIRRDGSEIWVSFNPDNFDDPTYKMFVANKRDDAMVKKTSWRDNPYFPAVLARERDYLRRVDVAAYNHVWEGEPREINDAQVFAGKWCIDAFDTPEGVDFYMGADWGFSEDPTTLVRCFIRDNRLFIDHEAYGVGVEISETPALFRSVPMAEKWSIRADSARPETISYMRQQGFNVSPAAKGAGSVEDGIQFIRSFEKIVIHERCKHAIEEFKSYSYKRDRLTNEILPVIVDRHNHCIDALRYALEGARKSGGAIRYI